MSYQEINTAVQVDGDRPYTGCGFLCSRTEMSIVQVSSTAVSDVLAEKDGFRDPDPCHLYSKVVKAQLLGLE